MGTYNNLSKLAWMLLWYPPKAQPLLFFLSQYLLVIVALISATLKTVSDMNALQANHAVTKNSHFAFVRRNVSVSGS